MDFYMDRKELLGYRVYLEDRACRIRARKFKLMDLGDGVSEIGEEEILASLIHLIRWISEAKEVGVSRVTIDLGEE
jgi:hypothetical protein